MTTIDRADRGTTVIDVLDRVLDKGIVIDAWLRVSIAGVSLITVDTRVVVASIETYLKHASSLDNVGVLQLSIPIPERKRRRPSPGPPNGDGNASHRNGNGNRPRKRR